MTGNPAAEMGNQRAALFNSLRAEHFDSPSLLCLKGRFSKKLTTSRGLLQLKY